METEENTTIKHPNDAHESIPKWHTKWHIGGRSAEWDKGSLGCEEMWGANGDTLLFDVPRNWLGFRWVWEHHCQTSEWNLNYQLLFVFCREWWNLMNIRGKWTQTWKVDQTLNIFAPDARPDNPQKPDILPKCLWHSSALGSSGYLLWVMFKAGQKHPKPHDLPSGNVALEDPL